VSLIYSIAFYFWLSFLKTFFTFALFIRESQTLCLQRSSSIEPHRSMELRWFSLSLSRTYELQGQVEVERIALPKSSRPYRERNRRYGENDGSMHRIGAFDCWPSWSFNRLSATRCWVFISISVHVSWRVLVSLTVRVCLFVCRHVETCSKLPQTDQRRWTVSSCRLLFPGWCIFTARC